MTPTTSQPTPDGPATAGPRPAVLVVRGVGKRYGAVRANDDVSLAFAAGEIHALLGENGAGKTTLLDILSGMTRPDVGEIELDGTPVRIPSPAAALALGIGTVYQHLTLVPTLTVAENVTLGAPGPLRLDLRGVSARLADLLSGFGLAIDPAIEVRLLSLGERQRVEIVKALFRGSRALLLDEPTSVLSPLEVEGLFAMLRRLRDDGVAVVIVTHKLDEALDLADRVTVLRRGRVVARLAPEDLSGAPREHLRERIVAEMFGGASSPLPVDERTEVPSAVTGPAVLALDDVDVRDDRGTLVVRGVALMARAGEIVGIAGVDGSGQTELAEAIAGQRGVAAGRVIVASTEITNRGVRAAQEAGIGYVTDDRLHEGIVASASVADNIALKTIARRGGFWLDRRAMREAAEQQVAAFDVRTPTVASPIGTLSGGNIQKVLLARELAGDPRVLVCNQPTHGLDLRTTRTVHRALRSHARETGAAIVVISSELDELLGLCDRIVVMTGGRIVGEVDPSTASVADIGRLMVGGPA